MSGNEAISGEVPGDIRSSIPNPTELDAMLPGSSDGDSLPGSSVNMDKANELLDSAGIETADLAGDIGAAVDTNLNDLSRDSEFLRSDILGGIGNLLDDSGRTAVKLQTHLMQQAINNLQEAYGYRAALGYDVPTMDEVNYVNSTGNLAEAFSGKDEYIKPGPNLDKPGIGTDETLVPVPTGGTPDVPPINPPTGIGETPTEPPAQPIQTPPAVTPPPAQPPQPPITPPAAIQPPEQEGDEPGQGNGFGNIGEQVIGRPILDPNNPRCPAGYALIGIENGLAICYLVEPKPEVVPPDQPPAPPVPPPIELPPDDINTPYRPTVPPNGIPVAIDPATCEYPRVATVKIGSGCTSPPPPKPPPLWIEIYCEGCNVCWNIYSGHDKPSVPSGHLVHGPMDTLPSNMEFYVHAAIDCKPAESDDEDEEEDEDDEDSDDGEGETEENGDSEDEENGDANGDGVRPEDRPQQQPDQYCNYITNFVAEANPILIPAELTISIPAPETALGRLIPSAARTTANAALTVVNSTIKSVMDWAKGLIGKAVHGTNCDRGTLAPIAAILGGFQAVQKILGFIPHQTIKTLTQASNTACQSEIPGPSETDVAYLRGDIDKDTWECWHKANGDYLGPAKKVMESQRAKIDPTQIDWLYRRKLLTQAEYNKLMREAGVIFDEDKQNIHDYNTVFPSLSDNVRLMNRDVSDETNIDWRKTDAEFRDKYKDKIKDYFDALGVPEQLALYYWRAAKHIPSFTMLTEMFHRLQSDMTTADLHMTVNDFKRALMQDDWSPEWVDRMIAISYKPVTRTDAIRAFMIHASDDETLHKQFRALGYTDDDAEFFVKYHKANRQIQDRRRSGYPTLRTLANQFARCEITESSYRDTVAKIVLTEEQEKAAIESAQLSRETRQRQQSIKSIRRPYTLGILDDGEASQMLAQAGVDPSCVGGLIDNWKLDRLRRDKYLTADQLCGMRERGIIDAPTQLVSLVRAGWDRESAALIVSNCGAILSEKAARKADTMARRAAADARRAQKEAERLRRLQECGPAPCPANRVTNNPSTGVPRSSEDPG